MTFLYISYYLQELGLDISGGGTHMSSSGKHGQQSREDGGGVSATPTSNASLSSTNPFDMSFGAPTSTTSFSIPQDQQNTPPGSQQANQTADSAALFPSFDDSSGWLSFQNDVGGATGIQVGVAEGASGGVAPESLWGDLPALDFSLIQGQTTNTFVESDPNLDFPNSPQSSLQASVSIANTLDAFNAAFPDLGSESEQAIPPLIPVPLTSVSSTQVSNSSTLPPTQQPDANWDSLGVQTTPRVPLPTVCTSQVLSLSSMQTNPFSLNWGSPEFQAALTPSPPTCASSQLSSMPQTQQGNTFSANWEPPRVQATPLIASPPTCAGQRSGSLAAAQTTLVQSKLGPVLSVASPFSSFSFGSPAEDDANRLFGSAWGNREETTLAASGTPTTVSTQNITYID